MSKSSVTDAIFIRAKQIAAEGIRMDEAGKNQDASLTYLQCVTYIMQHLLADARSKGGADDKFFKLCLQCIERTQEILKENGKFNATVIAKPSNLAVTSDSSTLHISTNYHSLPATLTTHSSPQFSPVSSESSSLSLTPASPRIEYDPLELASRENQRLIAAYRARIARTQGATTKYQLGVSLQRRLLENVAIAKSKHEELLRKRQARREKLKEDAARKFGIASGTKQDDEKKQIYLAILEYEQDQAWLLHWRTRLKESQQDTVFIDHLIKLIVSTDGHPLCQLLRKYQYAIYDKLKPLVVDRLNECFYVRVPFDGVEPGSALRQHNLASCSDDDDNADAHDDDRDDDDDDDNADAQDDKQGNENVSSQPTNQNTELLESGDHLHLCKDEGNDISSDSRKCDCNSDLADAIASSRDAVERALEKSNELVGQLTDDATKELPSSEEVEITHDGLGSLEEEALMRHSKNIINDVRLYMDRLYELFILAYELLDTPIGRDQVHASLEQPFLERLWPYLLPLFRLVYKTREINLAKTMTLYQGALPYHLSVKKKLSLLDSKELPYSAAILEVRKLINCICPLSKLEIIVQVCKIICMNVDDYFSAKGQLHQGNSIGADDLVPILSYVIVRSELPLLISELQAVEDFIHDEYLMGEEGYCLISLQNAVQYLESLSSG